MSEKSGILLAEIHHRTMNSFQVIRALTERCGRIEDIAQLPPILADLNSRVLALGAVHRLLARAPVERFEDHCSVLGHNLVMAFGRTDDVLITIETKNLPRTCLERLSLIIAELVTNCLKHSTLRAEASTIRIELRNEGGQLTIEARHDMAMPVSVPLPAPSTMVAALTASLGGQASVIDRGGYCARVVLPLDELERRSADSNFLTH